MSTNIRSILKWLTMLKLNVFLKEKNVYFYLKETNRNVDDGSVVSPPLLRSVNGAVNTTLTEILVLTSTSAKECYPRIHRLSLFSLSFSLFSLSLSLWPISGDSNSCRRRPKNRRGSSCWRDSRYKTRVLTAGHFLANTWRCIRRIKFLF